MSWTRPTKLLHDEYRRIDGLIADCQHQRADIGLLLLNKRNVYSFAEYFDLLNPLLSKQVIMAAIVESVYKHILAKTN